MNRRTLLRSAGVTVAVGLAGCVDGVQEHFGLQGVIPLEIYSEAEETHNLQLQAYDTEADRRSYEQSISVTPGESVKPQNLEKTEQRFSVTRIDDDEEAEVREASLTPETQLVVVRLYDDELVIEVDYGDGGGNETIDGDSEENETVDDDNGTDPSDDPETNESDDE